MSTHFEIKSQLAKLLATENINIMHVPGAQTAGFDVKNRNLILPVWQGISGYLYDMLVIHEVGHALDTPSNAWEKAIEQIAKKFYQKSPSGVTDKAKMAVKDFLNIVEDVRIDKRQKRRYPGCKNDYVHGLKELHERDFFGIRERAIDKMSFADRANIYFKGGIGLNIKFSDKEKAFLKRMENTETFADVVSLTEEIFDYAKNEEQNMEMSSPSADFGSEGEDGEDEIEMTQEEFDQMMENAQPASGSSSGNSIKVKIKPDTGEKDGEGKDKKKSDSKQGDTEDKKAKSQKAKSNSDVGGENDFVPSAETQQSAEKKAKDIILSSGIDYVYLKLPEFNMEHIVDDFKVVLPRMTKTMQASVNSYYNAYATGDQAKKGSELSDKLIKELTEWRKTEKESISFMVKEFEMRKSADTYARQSIAKTGVIDTNKLHSYLYNDDIFRRHTIIPKGKNHGFVMLVDWSSSMHANLKATLKQLYSLVMFCRQVQIPFEVYLFRTLSYNDHRAPGVSQTKPAQENEITFAGFRLLNVLSSRMNLSQLNQMMNTLYLSSEFSLGVDQMNSTPLNQSILAIADVVNAFQKKHMVQILSTIILTDGGSDSAIGFNNTKGISPKRGSKYFITDHRTKKTYPLTREFNSAYEELTTTMVKILKDRTNSNVLGFYLHSGGLGSVPPAMMDGMTGSSSAAQKSWRDNKFASSTNVGYDENYVVDANSMRKMENVLEIDSNATRNNQAKAFMKFAAKKKINRVLLSRFIERISLEKKKKE